MKNRYQIEERIPELRRGLQVRKKAIKEALLKKGRSREGIREEGRERTLGGQENRLHHINQGWRVKRYADFLRKLSKEINPDTTE